MCVCFWHPSWPTFLRPSWPCLSTQLLGHAISRSTSHPGSSPWAANPCKQVFFFAHFRGLQAFLNAQHYSVDGSVVLGISRGVQLSDWRLQRGSVKQSQGQVHPRSNHAAELMHAHHCSKSQARGSHQPGISIQSWVLCFVSCYTFSYTVRKWQSRNRHHCIWLWRPVF